MRRTTGPRLGTTFLGTASAALVALGGAGAASADAPCGELDECRVLIEINATDGDIGFHALLDAEGWVDARIEHPDGRRIFHARPTRQLREQELTENFFESTEPVCEERLREDEDEEVVTLPEFLARFAAGPYLFLVKSDEGEQLSGTTLLTHTIPAAPAEVDFDGRVISWEYGDDLGECTTLPDGFTLAAEENVVAYQVVLEPEGEGLSSFPFTVQVPSNGPGYSVTVPSEYLAALPANAPLKVEVGAVEERPNGSFGNQTFSEEDGFCNNPDQDLCPDAED